MEAISVRQAVLADLEDLSVMFDAYRQFYGRTSDVTAAKAFLRARFNHGESVPLLAYADGVPAGFTQLYPSFSSVSLGRVFILNDLFVASAYRRSGVGARLLQAAIDYARSLSAVRVSLNTDIQNASAQAFYDAQGWKRDNEFYAYHYALPERKP